MKDPNVVEYVASIKSTVPGEYSNPTDFANKNLGQIVKIGGTIYRVEKGIQGRYGSTDRHRDVMQLTGADGKTYYMRNDGKVTTTAPPDVKDDNAFKKWYDSIGGA